MPIDVLRLYKGDSLALAYGPVPEQPIAPWVVKVRVRTAQSPTTLVGATLTATNAAGTERTGIISTASLTPATYLLVAKMTNATTGESKEVQDTFTVVDSAYVE